MNWHISHRFDKQALPLADRHYSRRKPGSPQFVPPARCLVLTCISGAAVWVTTWPYAEWTRHEWAGAWVNSMFRRESGPLASELIREAVAATRWHWPEVPELGMVTFIDESKVRHKRDPGRCYLRAGFKVCGRTRKEGLLALQLLPADMPEPMAPLGTTREMNFAN
ncbi:MAG: hypothetical protein KGL39_36305 [Patescibacteria group bacterium]|nr:hypothetical protein [Patescibacteria group bacterium]